MKKANRVTAVLRRFIEVCFFLLMLWILLVRCEVVAAKFPSVLGYVLLICGAILCVFLLFKFLENRERIGKVRKCVSDALNRLSRGQMVAIITLVSLLTKTAVTFLFQIDSSKYSDPAVYYSFVEQLVDAGRITEHAEYAAYYSYTLAFSLLFVPVGKLFGVSITNFTMELSVLHTIVAILFFDLICYWKEKNTAFVAVLFWVLVPTTIVQTQLMCHENGFLFFHVVAIWFLFRVVPSQKQPLWKLFAYVMGCLSLCIAALINMIGYVSICALVVYLVLTVGAGRIQLFSTDRTPVAVRLPTRIGSILICVLILFGSSWLIRMSFESVCEDVIDGYQELLEQRDSRRIPYSWSVYVGMNYETAGEWNEEDQSVYYLYEEIEDDEEAIEYQINLLAERFAWYCEQPMRIIIHLNDKMQMIWGHFFNPLGYGWGNDINDAVLNWKGGILYQVFTLCCHLINIAAAAIIVLSAPIGRRNRHEGENKSSIYIYLFLIGATLVFLFVEVSPKYSSHMQVFIYLLAVLRSRDCLRNLLAGREKLQHLKSTVKGRLTGKFKTSR
ncbi:MAG: glycosyltransferase family 39 protein [Clostridiales bacterium]|nr:glycosyltransferase family 39 protein [Clostridiales bacterium]